MSSSRPTLGNSWTRPSRRPAFKISRGTFRHTFASRLVMAGVPLRHVAELMGHSEIQTTMRYAHLAPAHLANAVELLAAPQKADLKQPAKRPAKAFANSQK
ncbi:MAG TPA: tyrosine-type recombinase/integrase [Terriglobia bacterium]